MHILPGCNVGDIGVSLQNIGREIEEVFRAHGVLTFGRERVAAVLGQTVRRVERRRIESHFGGTGVHPVDESLFTAGHVLGNGQTALIARGDKHGFGQLLQRYDIAGGHADRTVRTIG